MRRGRIKKVKELDLESKQGSKEKEKITLEEFWDSKEKLAIHCDTEEQTKKLCYAFDRMGKKWIDCEPYTDWKPIKYRWNLTNSHTFFFDGEGKIDGFKTYEFEDVILPEEPKHEFKVGDRVQFKTWEEMEKEFGLEKNGDTYIRCRCGFPLRMKHLCGTYATITKIYYSEFMEHHIYKLTDFTAKGETGWIYSSDMLKPAVNEPKWQFTEDEKVILRNVDEAFKWMARDKNGYLWLYEKEPEKDFDYWSPPFSVTIKFNCFQHLFQTIKWKDEEPCEFRKYI